MATADLPSRLYSDLPGIALHHDIGLTREIAGRDDMAGTWRPDNRGRIICSISKLTMAAGSSPS